MIPTISYMQQAFDRYNQLCFKGELTPPSFKLSRSRTRLGWMKCLRTRRLMRVTKTHYTIALSVCYDLPVDELDDVLIHEMIHYYIAVKALRDNAPHGALFRQIMNEINALHGRHITVTARHQAGSLVTPRTMQDVPRLVLALEMADGTRYLSQVAPRAATEITRRISLIPHLQRYAWYESRHPYFATLPKVRTPRAVRVTPSAYDSYLAEAKLLAERTFGCM